MIQGQDNYVVVSWAGLLQSSTDVGGAAAVPNLAEDLTVQLSGTLGTGGAVTMQGSNDGTNWGDLHTGGYLASDDSEPLVLLNAVGMIRRLVERPLFVRPKVTAGDGDTDLVVTMVARIAG
jgi:hypothetical protein